MRLGPVWSPARAHARCCPRPAFRAPAGRVTSGGLIRKRRRPPTRQNRGSVGGRSGAPSEKSVTRKRKRVPVATPSYRWAPAAMDLLFGRRKTPEELLRQNQRALNRAMRELDRERQKLETQEKKIIADIKKMAKQGQMDAVRIMARDLVRTRRYVRKFVLMRANIQAVSLKIQTLKSNNSMAQAMKGVTKAMGTMNRQLKLPQIQKIMMEFERQAEIMDMKEEMMNDAIDDAMGDEDDEEESDAVVAQVLDELGLSLTDELSNLPSTGGSLSVAASGKKAEAAASALVDADADLEERLKNLRRD
ncbi:charged multivesicular body protein 2a isoform X1 [Orcinus orca]|uniref:charged multivesicular body protein 2a isoform X1 n=1 Tax=Tursiops truncatus TaxID=9739 RepID=UPI000951E2EF|nr:charged multivesicular body protein 2a isoform X1 [Orcinus orca]XP_030704232.2 charged multivesicular body protein 2a isoform X1 [Globicephala melas]